MKLQGGTRAEQGCSFDRSTNVYIFEVNKPDHPLPPSTCLSKQAINKYNTERRKTRREARKVLVFKNVKRNG
jgi:hypothetical protein